MLNESAAADFEVELLAAAGAGCGLGGGLGETVLGGQSCFSCKPCNPQGNHALAVTHNICLALHPVRREMLGGGSSHSGRRGCFG